MSKSCSTCAHIHRDWFEHPCATCSHGEERGNWEPGVRAMYERLMSGRAAIPTPVEAEALLDAWLASLPPHLTAKARRRAIAREWSTYLGRKIRARHVKAMLRLADDVEGGE